MSPTPSLLVFGATPGPSRSLATVLAVGLLALAAGGCTLVNAPGEGPSPAAEAPDARPETLSRQFGGQLSVQGSTFPVTLSLLLRGDDVEEALLAVPELGMEARGDGSLRHGRLVLDLEYGDDCEGEARVEGEVGDGGYVFQGALSARDCTGSEEGALLLRLRRDNGPTARSRRLVVESSLPGA